MTTTPTIRVPLAGMDAYLSIFGANGRNLSLLEGELGVKLSVRGADLEISGGEEDAATAQARAGDGGQIAGTNGQISTGAAAEEQRIPDGSAAAITIDDRTGEAGRAKEARANGASDADRAGGGGGDEA